MTTFIDRFFGEHNDLDPEHLGETARRELEPWVERFEAGEGTAFLPRLHGGVLRWYGLTPGGNARRELESLLIGWLGDSYTDVEQRRGVLDPSDPFDAWVEQQRPGLVLRFEVLPRADKRHRETVRQRLLHLVDLVDRRPDRPTSSSQSLRALVEDLQKFASSQDAMGSARTLDTIEQRRLVDAANLLFLKVQRLRLLEDWAELLAPDLLADLARLRVPPGVARAIAQATYELHLRDADGDAEALRSAAEAVPKEVTAIVGQTRSAVGRAELMVQSLLLGDRPLTVERLLAATDDEVVLKLLASPTTTEPDDAPVEVSGPTFDDFQEAAARNDHGAVLTIAPQLPARGPLVIQQVLLSADTLGDQGSAALALDLAEQEHGDLSEVRWPFSFLEQVVGDLRARQTGGAPTTWEDWLRHAAGGEAAELAPPSASWPPAPADDLLALVEGMDDEVLPTVVGALRAGHHEHLTPVQRAKLADACLEAMALSGGRREADRSATTGFLEDILDEPDVIPMLRIVELVDMLLDAHKGASTVDWMVDVYGELVEAATGDDLPLVAQLGQQMIEYLRPSWASVSRATYDALRAALKPVGTDLPEDLIRRGPEAEEEPPYSHLRGKRILIYSLRERPARRAAAVLRALGGGTQVDLSHEHGGSDRLGAMVKNADVVAMVTPAAKHAATDFIKANRAPDPWVDVNAVGTAALLTAIAQQQRST